MNDLDKHAVLAVVKFDLFMKEFEREFMDYFDDHIRELVLREGFVRSWRTREARRSWNLGLLEQEFCQIYQVDAASRFSHSNPANGMPPATEMEPWRRDLGGWGRVFYRIASRLEKDPRQGCYWARYEFNAPPNAGEQLHGAASAHLQKVLELPGVHRGWLLDHLSSPHQVAGAPAAPTMLLFEVDAPENIFDPSLGEDRIAWNSKAGSADASLVGRHFAHLLLAATDL
jgi:hypothetical protein